MSRLLLRTFKPLQTHIRIITRSSSSKDNLTAVLYAINDLRLEQRPIPTPNSNQVLLQMEVVGICGSDVHYVVDGRIGPFIVKKPMVIGHEAAGTVMEVGKHVHNLKKGDRVAIEPGVGCRLCEYCKSGRYHLCPEMKFCATPPIDGNLARFYVHDADFCFKLPGSMSLEEGALMEPLACGVHACKRAAISFGQSVLILGAGPIGLVTILASKSMGATKIAIIDIAEHRLSKAKELGANITLNVKDLSEDKIIDKLSRLLNNNLPDVSIDCSGAEICIRLALQMTKSGGVAVLVGMGKTDVNLPIGAAIFREVDIRGVFRYVNDYPTAIEMVRSGKIDVKPLITHHFKIEETRSAFETAKSGSGNPIKILIHPNPNWKK